MMHLDSESRRFLSELKYNVYGLPLYEGNIAGVDACYELKVK